MGSCAGGDGSLNEALILYALALGSPEGHHDCAEPRTSTGWAGYRWKRIYDFAYVYAGPLFIHQFSHVWIDFREIQDRYMAGERDMTISRTAGARPMCIYSTPDAIRASSGIPRQQLGG